MAQAQIPLLNGATPAAPSGYQNARWQQGPSTGNDPTYGVPIIPDSCYVPNAGKAVVKTANYSATIADMGTLLVFNSASALTLTLPNPIPLNALTPPTTETRWNVGVQNIGAGVLTINPNGLLMDTAAANLTLNQNSGFTVFTDGTNYFTERGAAGVTSLNALTGALNIVAGSGITVTPSGSNITIAATGGGGPGTGVMTRSAQTGSKTFGNVYQNTGSFPIVVFAYDSNPSAAVVALTDASNPPTTTTQSLQTFSGVAFSPIAFVVMPGNFYKITGNTTGGWNEFIFNTGTWSDSGNIAGSRSLGGTVFHNTGTGFMIVEIVITGTASGNSITVLSDSASTPTTPAEEMTTVTTTNSAFFLVPPGHYYSATVTGGTLSSWREISSSIPCAKSGNLFANPVQRFVGQTLSTNTPSSSLNNSGKTLFVTVTSTGSATNTMTMYSDNCAPGVIKVYACSITTPQIRTVKTFQMPSEFVTCAVDSGSTLSSTFWFEYVLG